MATWEEQWAALKAGLTTQLGMAVVVVVVLLLAYFAWYKPRQAVEGMNGTHSTHAVYGGSSKMGHASLRSEPAFDGPVEVDEYGNILTEGFLGNREPYVMSGADVRQVEETSGLVDESMDDGTEWTSKTKDDSLAALAYGV